ncbi:MAG: sulfotransferase family protein [Terriglobia bacterium]
MTLERHAREGSAPNLFLVGAPKCGTTSLYEYLRRHPQIFFPFSDDDYGRVKEPNHFCPELEILEKDAIKGRKDYLDLYRGSERARWRGDASTNYLFSETAAERIKCFCPNARILIMLRPPVDWMHSYHSELLRTHHEDIVDFYEALNASEDRRNGLRIPEHTGVPKCLDYYAMSRFAPQVERYYRVFGKDAVKVALLEDMIADPAATFRDILSFLDVDTAFQPEFRVHNETPRNGFLERVARSVYGAPLVEHALGAIFTWRARRGALSFIRRIEPVHQRSDPRDLQLHQLYAPEVERFSMLIGRNLDHWQP